MDFDNKVNKVLETDVLVIGGGMAGCCAAARAADHGLDVIVVEKAHTKRSGCAGMGIDHYESVPQGTLTAKMLTERFEFEQSRINGDRVGNPNILYKYFDSQWDTIKGLEDLGADMKWYDDDYYFFNRPDMFPGHRYWLRVRWQNIKPILSKAIYQRKDKVTTLERTMVVDVITENGRAAGVTAFNTRTGEFFVIKANAVVIATGQLQRAYESESPNSDSYKLRYDGSPSTQSGDGFAMAYRAGADLVNMDINGWMFRCRDDLVISFGNFEHNDGLPSHYFNNQGKEFMFADAQVYDKLETAGQTPLYRRLNHLPDDYFKRVQLCYVDEKMVDFKFASDRQFNPHDHAFEVTPFKPLSFMASSGVHIGEEFNTNVPGLFAIGDVASPLHSCSVAAGSAFLLADALPEYLKGLSTTDLDAGRIEASKERTYRPLEGEKRDIVALDLETSVRYICERYVGLKRSAGKLNEGLRRLGSLRKFVVPRVMTDTPHDLMRYHEALNILEMAEVHIESCLSRKETRGNFMRVDFPERDPARDNRLTHQRLENGKSVIEFKGVPDLNPELMKED
ncbi:FAD-dependent oxidoreductase [Verrucomicrobia bacterium]|nr:FAD-dependent oxidoreductase [Verrucomicrobiota bacterium]